MGIIGHFVSAYCYLFYISVHFLSYIEYLRYPKIINKKRDQTLIKMQP